MRASYGIGVWKAIRKKWEVVDKRVVFEEGDGARMLFWKDKWRDRCLCVLLFTLFLQLPLIRMLWLRMFGVS